MHFILDVHCHTNVSGHAYSSLEDNLIRAKEIGLQLVGTSEHGPAMSDSCPLSYFTDILKLSGNIGGMTWLKGVEANIIDINGGLDIPDDILANLDFCIASVHSGLFLPGDAKTNTAAVIGAMENAHVNIIGHLGDINVPINIQSIVDTAKKTGTMIEINNKSLIPGNRRYDGGGTIREILKQCKKQNVPVIAGSDAHMAKDVGRLKSAKALIKEIGIDEHLVMNTSVERFKETIKNKIKKAH